MIIDVLRLYERWGFQNVIVRPGKNGDEAWCACPFHGEEHPSFSVNMESGKWNCLACHERGRSIESLVRKMEHLETDAEVNDFIRVAAHRSTDEIRGGLRGKLDQYKAQKDRIWRMSVLGEEADTLRTDEHRRYAKFTHKYLPKRGFDHDLLGKHMFGYDASEQSVTIPVLEHGICRFVYRRTVTNRKPAYMYPRDVDKSKYLWGFDQPAEAYRGKPIIVTEGGLDALWVKQCGWIGGCAILGSFMSEAQAAKIAALEPSEVILFGDDDEAGYDMIENAGSLLLRHGIRDVYYLRYLASSKGEDPATCSREDIAKMIKRKRHYHHFRLASKVGRRTRIRNLLSIAHANNND